MSFSITSERGLPKRLGATPKKRGVGFAVTSHNADRVELCLFDETGTQELQRLPLPGEKNGVRFGFVPDLKPGARYGFRAHGPFDPARNHRFDPSKLLVDPYALRLDRPGTDWAHVGQWLHRSWRAVAPRRLTKLMDAVKEF